MFGAADYRWLSMIAIQSNRRAQTAASADGKNERNQWWRQKDKRVIVGTDAQSAQQRHRQKNNRQHPVADERFISRPVINGTLAPAFFSSSCGSTVLNSSPIRDILSTVCQPLRVGTALSRSLSVVLNSSLITHRSAVGSLTAVFSQQVRCRFSRSQFTRLCRLPLLALLHFLCRITFNGLTSPQPRSVPCSNSAFNSAAVCICKLSSATVSGPGASAIARLTASRPRLNKS